MTEKFKIKIKSTKPQAQNRFVEAYSKLSAFQKIVLFITIIAGLISILPIFLLAVIGLLPTIVIFWTDKDNLNKLVVVGLFNLSGCMPSFMSLIYNFQTAHLINLLGNIYNLVIMFGSAAIGLVLYIELPNFFLFLFKFFASQKQKKIENRLAKLSQEWGDEIL